MSNYDMNNNPQARREKRLAAEKRRKKKAALKRARIGQILFFPLMILFMEWVFHVSVLGAMSFTSFIFVMLYSFAVGWLVLYLPLSLIKKDKPRMITGIVLISVIGVLFLVEFFVTKAFKVMYEPKTILSGAKGVATGFAGDSLKQIFSFSGLWRIFLLLAVPLVTFLYFCRKWMARTKHYVKKSLFVGLCGLVCFFIALIGISVNSRLSSVHGKNYNFQNAVDSFGFLTALRLDMVHMNDKASFTQETNLDALVVEEGNSQESTQTVVPNLIPSTNNSQPAGTAGNDSAGAGEESSKPDQTASLESIIGVGNLITGYNRMDIDFAKLAEEADTQQLESLFEYAGSQKVTRKNEYTGMFEGKNLILVCAEAFSGYLLDPQRTPTLYRMATKGIQFTDFYQPASAGTTGGEVEFLLGVHPMDGGASMMDATEHNMFMTMGSRLKGYYGMAFHANDAEFYDRIITHNRLGYSEGFMGYGTGMEEYITQQWPQSDVELVTNTFNLYADHQPFNIYYMTVSGHSLYDYGTNAMAMKHWDEVADLDYSEKVKGYIACNLELEDAMTDLIQLLEQKGIADDTVIVICGDHFPYGLDDDAPVESLVYLNELYGFTVQNYLERDQNRLIIWSGSLEKQDPIVVSEPTMSIDILPTLLNLFGCEWDSRLLPGRDVFSDAPALVFNVNGDWKTSYGTYIAASNTFTPSTNATLAENYVDTVDTIVWNKMRFASGIIDSDFYDIIYDSLQK